MTKNGDIISISAIEVPILWLTNLLSEAPSSSRNISPQFFRKTSDLFGFHPHNVDVKRARVCRVLALSCADYLTQALHGNHKVRPDSYLLCPLAPNRQPSAAQEVSAFFYQQRFRRCPSHGLYPSWKSDQEVRRRGGPAVRQSGPPLLGGGNPLDLLHCTRQTARRTAGTMRSPRLLTYKGFRLAMSPRIKNSKKIFGCSST